MPLSTAAPQATPTALLPLEKRRAYREANRLIVAAGILLASSGVPKGDPALAALRAALALVNEGEKQN